MKSTSELYAKVIKWGNLLDAAAKARLRKSNRDDVLCYQFDLEYELVELQCSLVENRYRSGGYRSFVIQDPKRRLISAAPYRDRVLHHAICNIIEPLFEKRFVFDSYACRKGKGQVRALRRARYFAARHPFLLKTDIRRFFASIDHTELQACLSRVIRDHPLMSLIEQIISEPYPGQRASAYLPGDDLFTPIERRCGIPIGNQTSQLFGNAFLDPLDHFIKAELRAPGYVRYMDDVLVFCSSKTAAHKIRDRIDRFLLSRRLQCHPRKTSITPTKVEFPFLGFHVHPRLGFRPLRRTVLRFRKRLANLQSRIDRGEIAAEDALQCVAAYWGHFQVCGQTSRFRSILGDFPFFQQLLASKAE